MKHYYLSFVLFFLTVACSSDFDETAETVETVSLEQVTTYNVQAAAVSLPAVVSQLAAGYTAAAGGNVPTTLLQKITLLDSVSLQNTAFLQIKPVGYTVIGTTKAQLFLQNYSQEYTNLNASAAVRNYYELLIANESDLSQLEDAITADNLLTTTEKQLLHFILNCLDSNPPPGNGDDGWDKKMIVAAHLGFNESPAQAVFNVALLIVSQ